MPLDINRLQQALSIEAEKGFSNLQGKQFLFADFLNVSLQEIPEEWPMIPGIICINIMWNF